MSELTWTEEKPTKEGFYWHRWSMKDPVPRVIEVYYPIDADFREIVDVDVLEEDETERGTQNLLVNIYSDEPAREIALTDGEWAGPLEPPR